MAEAPRLADLMRQLVPKDVAPLALRRGFPCAFCPGCSSVVRAERADFDDRQRGIMQGASWVYAPHSNEGRVLRAKDAHSVCERTHTKVVDLPTYHAPHDPLRTLNAYDSERWRYGIQWINTAPSQVLSSWNGSTQRARALDTMADMIRRNPRTQIQLVRRRPGGEWEGAPLTPDEDRRLLEASLTDAS